MRTVITLTVSSDLGRFPDSKAIAAILKHAGDLAKVNQVAIHTEEITKKDGSTYRLINLGA